MADSDFQSLAGCLDATRVAKVSYSNFLDMGSYMMLEYRKLVSPRHLSSYNLCTENTTISCINSSVCESFQSLFYEHDANNLQFYDYVLTFRGEVRTYKYHFHISTHSSRVYFQVMYMWKPRKHITPAAILFVVARYAAFTMAVVGPFPVSVFFSFSSSGLSCSSL
jgi:hypothetical protein